MGVVQRFRRRSTVIAVVLATALLVAAPAATAGTRVTSVPDGTRVTSTPLDRDV